MARTPAKYCDLVMKGGITSGIVYPNAALALARDYRFKNIGGTSAERSQLRLVRRLQSETGGSR